MRKSSKRGFACRFTGWPPFESHTWRRVNPLQSYIRKRRPWLANGLPDRKVHIVRSRCIPVLCSSITAINLGQYLPGLTSGSALQPARGCRSEVLIGDPPLKLHRGPDSLYWLYLAGESRLVRNTEPHNSQGHSALNDLSGRQHWLRIDQRKLGRVIASSQITWQPSARSPRAQFRYAHKWPPPSGYSRVFAGAIHTVMLMLPGH